MSSSESQSLEATDTARGSTVSAGGNVSISASGAGRESHLLIQGSDVTAGGNARLSAEGDVNLLAAQNTASLSGRNQSASGSVGISFGTSGFGVSASVSSSRGKEAGDDLIHTHTHISAGNTVRIQSGNDTTLQGALVKADTIQADVGGDLKIESLQDTSTYTSQQKSSSASVTVGAGVSGSFSSSKSNVKNDFASVAEQSGLKAGDGGFQVRVGGNTDLMGGLVSSSDQAVQKGLNRFSTGTLTSSDIENSSHATASSSGVSLSSDMASQGKYGAAKAMAGNAFNNTNESESSSGRTLATVYGAQIAITDETSQKTLTGKTVSQAISNLNRDATIAHTAAGHLDVQAMKVQVEADRLIKQAVVAAAVKFTDAAYRTMFLMQHPVFEVVKGEDGQTMMDPVSGQPVLRELSNLEKQNLKPGPDGKVHLATNGIFNGAGAAGSFANQHGTTIGPQYLVHFPEADNIVSELLIAGYQKYLEKAFTGLSNSTAQMQDYMQQYGQQGLHLDGHSRGSMTIGNAMESIDSSSSPLSNTTINFFGPAYSAEAAARLLSELSGGKQDSVGLQNHVADPVGRLLGGNPDTGGTLPERSSIIGEVIRAGTGQENTTHNCYGSSRESACQEMWRDTRGFPAYKTVTPQIKP